MRCIRARRPALLIVWIALAVAAVRPGSPQGDRATARDGSAPRGTPQTAALALTDSAYAAKHPRLLYAPAEIPALYAKVRDGGADDDAYSFIRLLIRYIYPGSTFDQLLDGYFAVSTIPILGVGSALESPPDAVARTMGRNLTLYIANTWNVDDDNFGSALRLRALALGYDMFFQDATEAERTLVHDEILSYVDMMLNDPEYDFWSYRPYLANISTMIGSALGLAAICLDGEVDPAIVEAALDRADQITELWLTYHVDEKGTCNEGTLYGSWSMRHLVYYFWARVRYDGLDYGANPRIRNLERWFVYELHPDGAGIVNNIQDCSYSESSLAENTTYFDWAQTVWGSRLSAYIWEHVAGTYGHNAGDDADKAGTVIWHQNLTPQPPASVVPPSMVWGHRGFYYFRSGWPSGAKSTDVIFSFYSGQFQGGHAQQDQNQFTLYGYGASFAIDHGPGQVPITSEAHNMVLIDGKGQHFAGLSVGTDGDLRRYVINGWADYIQGDATDAYTTHSPLNNFGFPFPRSDWSWGYRNPNPVRRAYRSFFVVRDANTPPYFILVDDVDKDGTPHTYEWRLHTLRNNTIDMSANPIRISRGTAFMNIYVANPAFASLQKAVTYFDNQTPDPDSNVLSLTTTADNPFFALVLVPCNGAFALPTVTSTPQPWGFSVAVAWPSGKTDLLIVNRTGGPLIHTSGTALSSALAHTGVGSESEPRPASAGVIETDAELALLRLGGATIEKYILVDASAFAASGNDYVAIANGKATVGFSGTEIAIDRYDADFTLYAPGVSDVFYREQRIPVVDNNGYLTRDPASAIEDAGPRPAFKVRTYPNPFNPVSTIDIDVDAPGGVSAVIYDANGRLVKRLWNAPLPAGDHTLRWNGDNEAGGPAASGVYFLGVTVGGRSTTVKITLLR